MNQLQVVRIDTHATVSEERVIFGGQVQARDPLVATDIESADNHRPLSGGAGNLNVDFELLLLGGRGLAVEKKHLGTEQSDSLGAVGEGCAQLIGRSNIGRHFYSVVVAGNSRPAGMTGERGLPLTQRARLALIELMRQRRAAMHQEPTVRVDNYVLSCRDGAQR